MKAVVYSKFKEPPVYTQVDDPVPDPDGVVVEVKCSGLCLSDWHGWMGHEADIKLPHIPGHELSGVVVETGKNVTSYNSGDRVTLPFACGCGVCNYCREGNPQVCDHQFQPGFTHWGSFAQLVAIKYAQFNLVKIPDSMDFQTAAILGCRFATSFRAVVDQGRIRPDQWLVVFGCGGVGLSAIMIARAYEARVIAVDIDNSKLELAARLGAEHLINSRQVDAPDAIKDLTVDGAHLGLDAVGKPVIIHQSLQSLRKGGRHLQVGLLDPKERDVPVRFDSLIAGELQVTGSHGMQASRYSEMIQLITNGKLDPARLVTRTIGLAESAGELMTLQGKSDPGITVIDEFSS